MSPTNVVLLKGMEQIWRVILTVPDRNLALEATHFLIKMYLEVGCVQLCAYAID